MFMQANFAPDTNPALFQKSQIQLVCW